MTVFLQAKLPASEIAATINEFRSNHLSELTEVSRFQSLVHLNHLSSHYKAPIICLCARILESCGDQTSFSNLQLCETSGSSLGYGYSKVKSKPKSQPSDSSDENQIPEGSSPV